MNKKFSLKLAIVSLTIAALALAGLVYEVNSTYAAEGTATAVIGKATITKGTEIGGLVTLGPGEVTGFIFTAFEDQELYIIEKIEPKAGVHNGGYILDASGFAHDCPHHGKEVIEDATIGLPIEMVNDGTVVIILFGELGTLKKDN